MNRGFNLWVTSWSVLTWLLPATQHCPCPSRPHNIVRPSPVAGIGVVCWLLNVPATCECISGTDLLNVPATCECISGTDLLNVPAICECISGTDLLNVPATCECISGTNLLNVPATCECISGTDLLNVPATCECISGTDLLNVPATCECISGTDLLRQFYVLSHWDRSCRSNFPSHPVTVYWHRADQSQHWPNNARRLAG